MRETIDVHVYFNFRSPYGYIASKTMWPIFDNFHTNLIWVPVGGWNLRSSPDRAKVKVPIARQDLQRHAKRLGIPVNPPPLETDPTPAGAASLYAEEQGKLREFIVETMREEWENGQNIAEDQALIAIANRCGLDPTAVLTHAKSPENIAQLESNAQRASNEGIIGVPTFRIDDQIFWGQDRIEFVVEHLMELRAHRV